MFLVQSDSNKSDKQSSFFNWQTVASVRYTIRRLTVRASDCYHRDRLERTGDDMCGPQFECHEASEHCVTFIKGVGELNYQDSRLTSSRSS